MTGAIIQPGVIYEITKQTLPLSDIDSQFSDLYIRITPKSRAIINRLPKDEFDRLPALLGIFKSTDEHMWYDLPFCYMPYFTEKEKTK